MNQQLTFETGPPFKIPLGDTHLSEVKKGGLYIGIYVITPTLSKRGIILPHSAWKYLTESVHIIDLAIQSARDIALGHTTGGENDNLYGSGFFTGLPTSSPQFTLGQNGHYEQATLPFFQTPYYIEQSAEHSQQLFWGEWSTDREGCSDVCGEGEQGEQGQEQSSRKSGVEEEMFGFLLDTPTPSKV